MTWFVQSRLEERKRIEERLIGERTRVYSDILAPYIKLFGGLGRGGEEQAMKQMLSHDYRKTAFELNLIGSDEVVRAYNALMATSFDAEKTGKQDPAEMMRRWGELLLAIRKSQGNPKTKLGPTDMLRGMIKDIDQFL